MANLAPFLYKQSAIDWQNPPKSVRNQLQGLVQGEAWKIVLVLVTEKLRDLQKYVSSHNASTELRLYSVERQEMLLELLDMIYKIADEPNPVAEARIALTTPWVAPFQVPVPVPEQETERAGRMELPKYGAGSVR